MNYSVSNAYLRRAIHAICIGGATTLSLSALAAETTNADTPPAASSDSDLTEITVTGYRASIQQSLDIKRDSDGIVDAISAEDIGKFPDANLATAMERIPGVTVSRAAVALTGTGGTSSAGGSTQITVRGFGPQFNETLFDGRQVPTAIGNTSRGFDFGSVGSDFVGQLDVLKTPDSTLSSGSIGATINIKYPKPFDHPGLQLTASLSGDDNTGENKAKPNGGFLVSDTFADDRLGVLFDVAYADSVVRGDHVNIQGWEGGNPAVAGSGLAPCQLAGAGPCATAPGSATNPTTIKDWFIQDYGVYQEDTEDKRIGGRLALQARPIDGVEVTVDDNFARESLVQQQHGFSAWFNNGSLTDVTLAPDGTVTNFTQAGTPTDFQAQINQSIILTNTAGFNVKWDASEHASYMFDAYTAVAKLNPGGQNDAGLDSDIGYGNGPNGTNLGIVVPGGNNLPYPVGYGPGGDAANFANPAYIGSHVVVESYNQNKDLINQFKLEGAWHDDSVKFKYGVQFTNDHDSLRAFTDLPYTWQMYAGYGPAPIGSGGVAPIPAKLDIECLHDGFEFHQRLGQWRTAAAGHHCGQWLLDSELPAGFEWRRNERRCLQQSLGPDAMYRQVHHVSESRQQSGRHRKHRVAVHEHGDTGHRGQHAAEDHHRGALREHARDLGRRFYAAGRGVVHVVDRPHGLRLQFHPGNSGRHQEQLPLSCCRTST